MLINRFDFSEPQVGKIVCDRMAPIIKRNIHHYINKGNNCETNTEFVQAAVSTAYVTTAASKIVSATMIE